jgi:hypothetical protein
MDNILSAILVFILGIVFGWLFAHSNISTECQKLNSFYVGDTVFNCEVRK